MGQDNSLGDPFFIEGAGAQSGPHPLPAAQRGCLCHPRPPVGWCWV